MTYQIRHTMAFDGRLYDLESTMAFVRNMYDNDALDELVYRSLMKSLVDLRSGFPFHDDDFVLNPDGGFCSVSHFFHAFGTQMDGGQVNPVDLSHEEEIEDELDGMTVDLEADGWFMDEIEEMSLMNESIESV